MSAIARALKGTYDLILAEVATKLIDRQGKRLGDFAIDVNNVPLG